MTKDERNARRRARYAADAEHREHELARNRANKSLWRSGGGKTQNEVDYYLRSRYGIDLEGYQRKLEQQEGLCAVCGSSEPGGRAGTKRFAVDHDHETGAVRGLLCMKCNTALGKLNDDPALVASLLAYILSFSDVPAGQSLGG